jgi:predicted naringenin-chalcone synthase
MKKIIKLTESDLTRIVKRVILENEEQSLADQELAGKNIDVQQYCSPSTPPRIVTKILNKLPDNLRKKAIDFIKKFANAIKGKSVKELILLKRELKDKKNASKNLQEQAGLIVIAGLTISVELLLLIGGIILFIIIVYIIIKSSKGGGSCNPGWWDNLNQ